MNFLEYLKGQPKIKIVNVPAGHIAYSHIYGSVNNCTCVGCNQNIDDAYISVKSLKDFLDNKCCWVIKYYNDPELLKTAKALDASRNRVAKAITANRKKTL